MSEIYGKKPDVFTARWFEYIWNYYKWFIIGALAVILLVIFTVVQIRKTPDYDVTLTIAGDYLYGDDDIDKIKTLLNSGGEDINGDGEVTSDISQLVFVGDNAVDSAYDTRFILNLQEEDMLLYLMDKERFDRIIAQSFGDETFTPLDEWFDGICSAENAYYADGKAYGIKVSAGEKFNEQGINDGGLYLAVRKNYRSPEKTQKLYENCKKIAAFIME